MLLIIIAGCSVFGTSEVVFPGMTRSVNYSGTSPCHPKFSLLTLISVTIWIYLLCINVFYQYSGERITKRTPTTERYNKPTTHLLLSNRTYFRNHYGKSALAKDDYFNCGQLKCSSNREKSSRILLKNVFEIADRVCEGKLDADSKSRHFGEERLGFLSSVAENHYLTDSNVGRTKTTFQLEKKNSKMTKDFSSLSSASKFTELPTRMSQKSILPSIFTTSGRNPEKTTYSTPIITLKGRMLTKNKHLPPLKFRSESKVGAVTKTKIWQNDENVQNRSLESELQLPLQISGSKICLSNEINQN